MTTKRYTHLAWLAPSRACNPDQRRCSLGSTWPGTPPSCVASRRWPGSRAISWPWSPHACVCPSSLLFSVGSETERRAEDHIPIPPARDRRARPGTPGQPQPIRLARPQCGLLPDTMNEPTDLESLQLPASEPGLGGALLARGQHAGLAQHGAGREPLHGAR